VAIAFDPAKNARNIRERKPSFERVEDFDFETATFEIDDRDDMQMSKADAPDAESPEWTEARIRNGVPFSALPDSVKKVISNLKRGPQKAPTKVPVSIRLSPDVVAGLRATGEGWQVRADEALRAWLLKHESPQQR
jgi:uncharacterized protein (DUF4415 family)